jgi:hypothetical protein
MEYKIIKNYPNHKIYENGDIINIKNKKLTICKDNRVGLSYMSKYKKYHQWKLLYENFHNVTLLPDQNVCLIDKNKELHYTNIKILPKGWQNNEEELDPNKEWKNVKGYPEYKISNYGDVYSIRKGRILIKQLDEYYKVNLNYKNRTLSKYIHRLVYDTFVGLTDKNLVVDHKDRDKLNNYIGNLRETTVLENNMNCEKQPRGFTKIAQYDKNNQLIKIWESYNDILQNTNYKRTTLITCCLGNSQYAYGYIWKDLSRLDDNSGYTAIQTYDKHTYSNYKINRKGEVINSTNKILTTHLSKKYLHISLMSDEGSKIQYSIHRLVAMTFIPNPKNLPHVDHIDKNKLNNDISNLEWVTIQLNNIRANGKTVYQIDMKTNEIIKTYISVSTAERELKITGISRACTGKSKSCKGYRWRYVE